MIKCDRGFTGFEGTGQVIASELTCIIKEFREIFEERIGKEETEKLLNKIIKNSRMSDEEMAQKISDSDMEKALDHLLDSILNKL